MIISARGEQSFTPGQLKKLRSNLDCRFLKCMAPLSGSDFVRLARPYAVLGITRRAIKELDRTVIEKLLLLEGIAIYATGHEWVDTACLRRRKIVLSFLPDYATVSVAEHAFGCLLALSRRIHLSFDRVRGIVPSDVSLRGWELRGKTLGIIGYGRIGRQVARFGAAFGMCIIFTDDKKAGAANVRQVPLIRLLKTSDAVILCCSQSRNSRQLLGRKELERMKRSTVLVNVGRAGLVDNNALLSLLKAKRIAGYAVDDSVELFNSARGLEPGRILQTGHTAWYSNEAIARGTQAWVDNLAALGSGRARNLV